MGAAFLDNTYPNKYSKYTQFIFLNSAKKAVMTAIENLYKIHRERKE